MEFLILHDFKRGYCPAGVYKLTFDDKWFYIGSSFNLKNRATTWRCKIAKGLFKNKNIKHILPGVSVVKFEVIKVYATISLVRDAETRHIAKHWDNPLFLNRCPDAKSNVGIRADYLGKPVKIKPEPKQGTPAKRVAVFNLQDQLIKVCKSFGECSREFKIKHEDIWKILAGKRGHPAGIVLKSVANDGRFVEAVKFIHKTKGLPGKKLTQEQKDYVSKRIKEVYALHPELSPQVTHAKKVNMYKDDVLQGSFPSISQLAREKDMNTGNICKVLTGKWPSYRGFTFKYA